MTCRSQRITFWIVLGILSTLFAEVLSSSTIAPLFVWHGYVLIIPLYLLHTIILAKIIYSYGKPTLPTLYLAGMLFGLYEAYITKVLWNPSWTEPLFLGEVGVTSFIILVFWWHAFISFLFPILFGEGILSNSSEGGQYLPKRLRALLSTKHFTKTWLILLAILGIIFGARIVNPALAAGVLLVNGLILFIIISIWRKTTKPAPFKELLPNKTEFIILCVLLGIFYIITGIFLMPENFPGIIGHVSIIIAYLVIGGLFIRNLTKKTPVQKVLPSPRALTWKTGLLSIAVAIIGGVIGALLPPIGMIFGVIMVLSGIIIFIWSIKRALTRA